MARSASSPLSRTTPTTMRRSTPAADTWELPPPQAAKLWRSDERKRQHVGGGTGYGRWQQRPNAPRRHVARSASRGGTTTQRRPPYASWTVSCPRPRVSLVRHVYTKEGSTLAQLPEGWAAVTWRGGKEGRARGEHGEVTADAEGGRREGEGE